MILVRASLVAPVCCSITLTEQLACDLLWLRVTPSDRVEHIRVQTGAHGFEIVWFMLGDDQIEANKKAHAICLNAIITTPALAGWQAVM